MTDIRELLDDLVREPAEPRRGWTEALAAGRSARRRRTAAGAVGVVVVLGLGVAAGTHLATTPRNSTAPHPAASASALPGIGWPEQARTALAAAVPTGYQLSPFASEHGSESDGAVTGVFADLLAPDGRGGQVFAYTVERPDLRPSDDPCRLEMPREFFFSAPTTCDVVKIGTVRVRVATVREMRGDLQATVEYRVASVYGSGWAVHVWEAPFVNQYAEKPRPLLVPAAISDGTLAVTAAGLAPR